MPLLWIIILGLIVGGVIVACVVNCTPSTKRTLMLTIWQCSNGHKDDTYGTPPRKCPHCGAPIIKTSRK